MAFGLFLHCFKKKSVKGRKLLVFDISLVYKNQKFFPPSQHYSSLAAAYATNQSADQQ